MTKIKIELDKFGQGKIILDKKDISKYVIGGTLVFGECNSPVLNLSLFSENFEIVSEIQKSQINIDNIEVINPTIK